jgi:hypothetical protein
MTLAEKLRQATEVLTWSSSKAGSDTCGCDECARKRARQRAKVLGLLCAALKDLNP